MDANFLPTGPRVIYLPPSGRRAETIARPQPDVHLTDRQTDRPTDRQQTRLTKGGCYCVCVIRCLVGCPVVWLADRQQVGRSAGAEVSQREGCPAENKQQPSAQVSDRAGSGLVFISFFLLARASQQSLSLHFFGRLAGFKKTQRRQFAAREEGKLCIEFCQIEVESAERAFEHRHRQTVSSRADGRANFTAAAGRPAGRLINVE